jgi:hypothetical protein
VTRSCRCLYVFRAPFTASAWPFQGRPCPEKYLLSTQWGFLDQGLHGCSMSTWYSQKRIWVCESKGSYQSEFAILNLIQKVGAFAGCQKALEQSWTFPRTKCIAGGREAVCVLTPTFLGKFGSPKLWLRMGAGWTSARALLVPSPLRSFAERLVMLAGGFIRFAGQVKNIVFLWKQQVPQGRCVYHTRKPWEKMHSQRPRACASSVAFLVSQWGGC